MWNKEIKIFKEYNYTQLPDYQYKSPRDSRGSNHRHSSPYNKQLCDPREVTERTNAQVIQDELERTVSDITSTVSFSPDVLEERVPQLLPYNPSKTIYRIPPGLQSSRDSRRMKEVRICPTSHLPCILRDCSTQMRHTHPGNQRGIPANRLLTRKSPIQYPSLNPSRSPAARARAVSRDLTADSYEDEIFLSKISSSTVELIVTKMTQGLQQDRLRKKFKIPPMYQAGDQEPIRGRAKSIDTRC